MLWLYNVNVIGVYALAWGAALAFALLLSPGVGSPTRRRGLALAAYAAAGPAGRLGGLRGLLAAAPR